MPTYDYECKECGHNFEAFQSMSDDPLAICPACQGPLRRLIGGGTGVIFKGSGFYVTDSRKKSEKAAAASKKDDKAGDSKDATSGADKSPEKADKDSAKDPSDKKDKKSKTKEAVA